MTSNPDIRADLFEIQSLISRVENKLRKQFAEELSEDGDGVSITPVYPEDHSVYFNLEQAMQFIEWTREGIEE